MLGIPSPGSSEASLDTETDAHARWLLVQEFNDDGSEGMDVEYLDLMRKEAKHWWYKNGWKRNSVAFYRLQGLGKTNSTLEKGEEVTYDKIEEDEESNGILKCV